MSTGTFLILIIALFAIHMILKGDEEVRRSEEYWEFVEHIRNHPTMPDKTKREIIEGATEMRDKGLPL